MFHAFNPKSFNFWSDYSFVSDPNDIDKHLSRISFILIEPKRIEDIRVLGAFMQASTSERFI